MISLPRLRSNYASATKVGFLLGCLKLGPDPSQHSNKPFDAGSMKKKIEAVIGVLA